MSHKMAEEISRNLPALQILKYAFLPVAPFTNMV